MNGLSLRDICCLFCCPPCPSSIASKITFSPSEPSYSFIPAIEDSSKMTLHLTEKAEWQFTDKEKECIEVSYTQTKRGNTIACMFVRCSPTARYCILFSQGARGDLGQMSSFLVSLGKRIGCNFFSYDYSGYGVSTGKPSEKNIYSDIQAAWDVLKTRYGISPENIILYGQSFGSVATIDLASRYDVGGVILHSPFMSGIRLIFNTKRTYMCDAFPSIEKLSRIKSPVLVIHGTADDLVDVSHGRAIHERCQRPVDVEPLWVEGAGHHDIELYSQYLERLRNFVNVDLSN